MSLPVLSNSNSRQPATQPRVLPVSDLGETPFRTLFEFSPDAILLIDPQANWSIVDCNEAACRMNGYTRTELLGQSIDILDPAPNGLESRTAALRHIHQSGQLKFETVHRHKNGTIFPVEVSNTLIYIAGRELILGIDRDITDRKRADELLRKQNNFLAALHETTVALLSGLDLTDLLENILNHAASLFKTAFGYIYLLAADGESMEVKVDLGLGAPSAANRRPGEGIVGLVWQSGQPLAISNYDTWSGRAPGIPLGLFKAMMAAPLVFGGQVQGVIGLGYTPESDQTLGASEIELLTRFAQLASLALENARALQTERVARQHAVMLQAATQALTSSLDLEVVLNLILTKLGEVVPYDSASVQEIRQDQLEIIGGDGFPNWEQIRGLKFDPTSADHPNHEVLNTRQPFILNDVTATRFTAFQSRLHRVIGIRSWLGVPLLYGSSVIGMISLDKREANFYTPEHGQMALAFATQAAIAISNARTYASAQTYAAENEALYHASSHLLNPGTDPSSLAAQITHAVIEEFELANCSVLLVNDAGDQLSKIASAGDINLKDLDSLPLDGPGLMVAAAVTGEMVYAPDVTLHPRYVIGDPRTRSELVMPLKAQDKVIGVLDLQSRDFSAFDESDQRVIAAFAKQAGLAFENIRLVTNLAQAYRQLQADQDQLLAAEKMASLGRLTAGIAHEMNTPLAAVRSGLAELTSLVEEYQAALDDPAIGPNDHREISADMRKVLQLSTAAAERAAAFVRSVKSQTRADKPADRQLFDMVPVVKDTLVLLAHALRQGNTTVHFDSPPQAFSLVGSPGRLAQVITNLVTNSIDACADQGGGLITIRLWRAVPNIILQVTDTGSGIPANLQSRIFEPMFTTKPFGQGTGLGLTIIHDIVTGDFGGTIEVASQPGQGTTFTLQFPPAKEESHGA